VTQIQSTEFLSTEQANNKKLQPLAISDWYSRGGLEPIRTSSESNHIKEQKLFQKIVTTKTFQKIVTNFSNLYHWF